MNCFARFVVVAAILFGGTGCKHNLQRSYIEAMVDTRSAIMADVKVGLYRPDARSDKTLEDWRLLNLAELEALIAQEQKEGF